LSFEEENVLLAFAKDHHYEFIYAAVSVVVLLGSVVNHGVEAAILYATVVLMWGFLLVCYTIRNNR
jgi:hypothetical protein